jgi:hypothetical protein
MRLPPLLVLVALGLAGCDADVDPNPNADATDDGSTDTGAESGTDTGETGDPVGPIPRPEQPLCEGPILCDGWTSEGGEEPSSQLFCHYEVLRDADQPAHLQVRGDNDEPDVTTRMDHEFFIDGVSRWVTVVTSRYDAGQLLSRSTEICELRPSPFFDDCPSHGCWPNDWAIDCMPADDCE